MAEPESGSDLTLHRHSHLSAESAESGLTEFEFALHHIMEAFRRWAVELNTYVSGEALPAQDVSVLQVVRMQDRPKSATDIAKFLNRDDAPNVLYGLRKLERAGLIRKIGRAPRQTMYEATERGRAATDRYAALRRELLVRWVGALTEPGTALEDATKTLWMLTGLYEQAARTVSVTSLAVQREPVADSAPPDPLALDPPPPGSQPAAEAQPARAQARPRKRAARG